MVFKFENSNIYFNSCGLGKPLVLLHGFLESSTIWDDFVQDFSKRRQIITIDLPGHGNSQSISETHSMELMAGVVFGILQSLNIQKADFLGHSMGGYVSLAFLEARPEMVNSIILLNSTPKADSEVRKTQRDKAVELVKQNKRTFVSLSISNLLTAGNIEKFGREVEALKEEAQQFGAKGIIAAIQGMKIRKDRTSILKSFKGGKYILAGKRDPVLDYQEIKKISKKCGCRLFSFPDGHLSYLENNEVCRETVYFIEKNGILSDI